MYNIVRFICEKVHYFTSGGFFFSKIMKYNKFAINDKQEILHCNITMENKDFRI